MSEPLKIAFVVEGPTDHIVLNAVASSLLGEREFEPVHLCPEVSAAFSPLSGGGWTQVYLWCKQASRQAGGPLRTHEMFDRFDALIVHLDGDVAGKTYADDQRIVDAPDDLPCQQPCPPAAASTTPLRRVLLAWMSETAVPPKTALCTPSKSTDTWVLVALFPNNRYATGGEVECFANAVGQLQTQPVAHRLVRGGKKEIYKYQNHASDITRAWARVRSVCGEAERFSAEFTAALK